MRHKNTILFDDWDKYIFHTFEKQSNSIKNHNNIIELLQDTFCILYKPNYEFTPIEQVNRFYLINKVVIEKIISLEMFQKLKVLTTLNSIQSYIGLEKLIPIIKTLLDQIKAQTSEPEKIEGTSELDFEEATELYEYLKTLDTSNEFKLNSDIKQTINEIVDTADTLVQWGININMAHNEEVFDPAIKLIKYLQQNKKLASITELTKKFKMHIRQLQAQSTDHNPNELYSLSLGDDLSLVVPNEFLNLVDEDFQILFYKNFIEKSLLQYEMQDLNKTYGPIIVCIDTSSSMQGENDIWSKAVALTIIHICKIHKRDAHIIQFASGSKFTDLYSKAFLYNKYNYQDMVQMASYFIGGGTEFEPALNLAKDLIENAKECKKADIVFITDGEAPITKSWEQNFNKWKDKQNVKVWTILIDRGQYSAYSVTKVSDLVIKLTKLSEKSIDDIMKKLL